MVLCEGHPHATRFGYILEHRLKMEKKLGRLLTRHELVHHKNGDKKDNHLSNLKLVTHSEHQKIHGGLTSETLSKLRNAKKFYRSGLLLKEVALAIGLCEPTTSKLLKGAGINIINPSRIQFIENKLWLLGAKAPKRNYKK